MPLGPFSRDQKPGEENQWTEGYERLLRTRAYRQGTTTNGSGDRNETTPDEHGHYGGLNPQISEDS